MSPIGIEVLGRDESIDDVAPGLVAKAGTVSSFASEIGVGFTEGEELGACLKFLVRQQGESRGQAAVIAIR